MQKVRSYEQIAAAPSGESTVSHRSHASRISSAMPYLFS
jgi:hypothetical protein